MSFFLPPGYKIQQNDFEQSLASMSGRRGQLYRDFFTAMFQFARDHAVPAIAGPLRSTATQAMHCFYRYEASGLDCPLASIPLFAVPESNAPADCNSPGLYLSGGSDSSGFRSYDPPQLRPASVLRSENVYHRLADGVSLPTRNPNPRSSLPVPQTAIHQHSALRRR